MKKVILILALLPFGLTLEASNAIPGLEHMASLPIPLPQLRGEIALNRLHLMLAEKTLKDKENAKMALRGQQEVAKTGLCSCQATWDLLPAARFSLRNFKKSS